MLVTTGIKEKLSASKGSEIEVSCYESSSGTGDVWYGAVLEENLAKSKRKKLSVRHLKPLDKEDYSPPLIKSAFHRLIRPVPPQDPFLDVDFEEGDCIDVAHKGGWWYGWVVKVLGNRRYLVYLRFEPDVIEVDRNDLRPHLVWQDEEWFRCEKRVSLDCIFCWYQNETISTFCFCFLLLKQLIESDFSAGKTVEVRTELEQFGDVWAPAMAIKENDDGTLLVKTLSGGEDECTKINIAYSKIRPSPPPFGSRVYRLMEKVEALIESGWCRGIICKVLSGNRYAVFLGKNKRSQDFNHLKLRPSIEWTDGVWKTVEKVVLRNTISCVYFVGCFMIFFEKMN